MTVHEVDFGKTEREARRAFYGLLRIVDIQHEQFLQDPQVFFEAAAREIAELQATIERARSCLAIPVRWHAPQQDEEPTWARTVTVCADEYERLKACAAIIQKAT